MSDTQMPPREESAMLKIEPDCLTIGKVSNGQRIVVGMQLGMEVWFLSPKAARHLAKGYDGAEAILNDLGWVATALRECAREVKAMTKAEHAEMVAQSAAMVEAHGATKQ